MRLADFILANVEPILMEWETFAREIWEGSEPDPATLRDLKACATPAELHGRCPGHRWNMEPEDFVRVSICCPCYRNIGRFVRAWFGCGAKAAPLRIVRISKI